ncbi:MAG: dihydrofolate reductase family protein [Acidimicrobiia bacterium]
MRRVIAFEVVTADGFYEGEHGEFDWPKIDEDFFRLSVEQTSSFDTLLYGRATYEGMASYWPTPVAAEQNPPDIVDLMNRLPKVVFANSTVDTSWDNTTLITSDAAAAVTEMKQEEGGDMGVYGSFRLVTSLLDAGLLDELRVMIHPILLGRGKPMFSALADRIRLELIRSTTFASGSVLLRYRPLTG